jgi:hypothetical protein
VARRQPREGNRLRRRAPRREPYDRVLIVCEGEKTEPNYFSELKDHYRLSNANIAVTRAGGTDPLSIVRTAKQLQAKEQKQGDRYDRVYCVFDRDRHANFQTACDQIKQSEFHSARSWPCFEYWLLLHFRYTRAAFTESGNHSPCDNCIKMLKQEDAMHDYAKGTGGAFGRLLDRIDLAKQRAGQTRQDAQATGDDNPSTEVHELVDYLQHLKDPA